MPIDDHPFDALNHQIKMEELSESPIGRGVLAIASKLPLPWPFDKAIDVLKEHIGADSRDRMGLMLETCMNEVRKHDNEIKCLREAASTAESREKVLKELILDAARRAEGTRAKDRVKRIGLILGNAVIEPKLPDGDEVEEMMRVAMELSDRDVRFLRDLIGVEGPLLERQEHIPRFDAHTSWERGPWGTRVDTEIDSVFSKLESYGLVARIPPPNNLNLYADFQNRYVLLKKGARFATLVREAG